MSADWGGIPAVLRGLAQGRLRRLAVVAACVGALSAAPAGLAGTVTIAPEADTFVATAALAAARDARAGRGRVARPVRLVVSKRSTRRRQPR